MIQKIARINMGKGDIEYLEPIKDYTPVLDERWKDIFPFKNRLPLFGLKTTDDKPYIYIEVTDEQDLEEFLYIKTLRDPDRNKRRYPYNHYIWQLAIVRGIVKGIVFKSITRMNSNDYYFLEDEIILFDTLLKKDNGG